MGKLNYIKTLNFMDPILLEKRRIKRLNSKIVLPKGLSLWSPSEEIDSEDLFESSSDEIKNLAKTKNLAKNTKRKSVKFSQKENPKKFKNSKKNKNSKKTKNSKKLKTVKFSQNVENLAKSETETQNSKEAGDEKEKTTERSRPIGPCLPPVSDAKVKGYGSGLYQGEGEAIANFVQKGMRIPRRGEVGLTSKQIEEFEALGYVMSGSRHKRMNAIRIRKENQVYSAEEKKALSLITFEEKQQRENKIIGDLKSVLNKKYSESEAAVGVAQNEDDDEEDKSSRLV